MNESIELSLPLRHGRLSWLESCPASRPHSGAPPVLIFLHGLAAGSFCWRAQLEAWGGWARCLAPDLPGYGGSDPLPGRSASLGELSAALFAWLEALGIGHYRIVGSSWGGSVAMWLAGERAANCERLLLIAPLHPDFIPCGRQRLLMRPLMARMAAGLLRHGPRSIRRQALEAMWGNRRRLQPEVAAAYAEALARTGFGAAAHLVRGWREDQTALAAAIGQLCAPAMLVWGGCDRVVPAESATALLARLPAGTPLKILPGLGHLPFQEQPAAFQAAVEPFLFPDRF